MSAAEVHDETTIAQFWADPCKFLKDNNVVVSAFDARYVRLDHKEIHPEGCEVITAPQKEVDAFQWHRLPNFEGTTKGFLATDRLSGCTMLLKKNADDEFVFSHMKPHATFDFGSKKPDENDFMNEHLKSENDLKVLRHKNVSKTDDEKECGVDETTVTWGRYNYKDADRGKCNFWGMYDGTSWKFYYHYEHEGTIVADEWVPNCPPRTGTH